MLTVRLTVFPSICLFSVCWQFLFSICLFCPKQGWKILTTRPIVLVVIFFFCTLPDQKDSPWHRLESCTLNWGCKDLHQGWVPQPQWEKSWGNVGRSSYCTTSSHTKISWCLEVFKIVLFKMCHKPVYEIFFFFFSSSNTLNTLVYLNFLFMKPMDILVDLSCFVFKSTIS